MASLVTELDGRLSQHVASAQSKCLAYGLVGPTGLVHSAGFGVLDDAVSAPDNDTVFPIASLSKSFVACAALLAGERGQLDLHAPIGEFFDIGRDTDLAPADQPTLHMLLRMAGGLAEDNAWVNPLLAMPEDEFLERVSRGLRFSSAPGSTYEYSNVGFALAGLAIAKAVGMPLEDYVREEILRPLGMTRTWFDNRAPSEVPNAARGYSRDPSGEWLAHPPVRSGALAAAGGMQSTVGDLATWICWLGGAFRPDDRTPEGPLGRASRRDMQRLHSPMPPALNARPDGTWKMSIAGYGLGLVVHEDMARGTIVTHSGGMPGFLLNMSWHPDSGHGIVLLTNSDHGNPLVLAEEALFRVLDRRCTPARTIRMWAATRELLDAAERLIRSWDDDLAADIFAENIDIERPLRRRREEIARLVAEIGGLGPARSVTDVLSADSPADVTWAVAGMAGELLCRIHLSPLEPPRIQEFTVRAARYDTPRSARRTYLAANSPSVASSLGSRPNHRVLWDG